MNLPLLLWTQVFLRFNSLKFNLNTNSYTAEPVMAVILLFMLVQSHLLFMVLPALKQALLSYQIIMMTQS